MPSTSQQMLKTQNVEKREIKGPNASTTAQEEAQVAHGMKQREAVPVLNYIIERIKNLLA